MNDSVDIPEDTLKFPFSFKLIAKPRFKPTVSETLQSQTVF